MIATGTIVEIYEDPFTKMRKEGDAKVIAYLQELDPGVHQCKVHFLEDKEGVAVTRTIVNGIQCTCLQYEGDDINCRAHGRV